MDQISKKELLAATGISYGQLYRWKRERLIPEEWFIKQASFTGQETFFPREQVLQRIRAIQELKEVHSLDEVAALFSEDTDASMDMTTILRVCEGKEVLPRKLPAILGRESFTLGEVAFADGLGRLAASGAIPEQGVKALLRQGTEALAGVKPVEMRCTACRADRHWFVCFTRGLAAPVFDGTVTVLGSFSLEEAINNLRTRSRLSAGDGE